MRRSDNQEQRALSLGFIGGGLSSAVGRTHYNASQMDGKWHLEAGVFSRNNETNQRTASCWHVPPERVYEDWRTFLKHEAKTLDAVAVLTPTPIHAEIVKAALESGLSVICEKALATSIADCEDIYSIVQSKNSFLAVTYNYSGYPIIRELRQLILKGELGVVQQIHIEMPQEGFVHPPDIAGSASPPQAWRLVDGEVPTICLDLGDHLHHLVHFLTGIKPRQVMAEFENFSTHRNLIDNIMMWVRYETGMRGCMWMSKTAVGHRNGLKVRVFGDRGSAEWYQMEPENLYLSGIGGARWQLDRGGNVTEARNEKYNRFKAGHPSGFLEAFANLYSDLADAVSHFQAKGSHSNPYVFGADHALNSFRLFDAARRSMEHGAWENV